MRWCPQALFTAEQARPKRFWFVFEGHAVFLSKKDMFGIRCVACSKEKAPAASLFSRKQGLGTSIHIKIPFI